MIPSANKLDRLVAKARLERERREQSYSKPSMAQVIRSLPESSDGV